MKYENIGFRYEKFAKACAEDLKAVCKRVDIWFYDDIYTVSYLALGREAKQKALAIGNKYIYKEMEMF